METSSTVTTDPAPDKLMITTHATTTIDNTDYLVGNNDDSLDFSSNPSADDAITEEANREQDKLLKKPESLTHKRTKTLIQT